MNIYIAASWKHQACVEMLTQKLRDMKNEVVSFVEDGLKRNFQSQPFEQWMRSEDAFEAFEHDSNGAMNCDVLIYIGPSGQDASAECGMAYSNGAFMIALHQKGEAFGLMRKMFADRWCDHYTQVLELVKQFQMIKEGI